MEVESTIRPAKDRIAGFEDRGSHRTPFASVGSIAGDLRTSSGQRGGPDAACCATTRDGAMKVKRSHSRRECSGAGLHRLKLPAAAKPVLVGGVNGFRCGALGADQGGYKVVECGASADFVVRVRSGHADFSVGE